jgi:hypothetical protein
MTINKQHLEFHVPDMSTGWETPPGYAPGAALQKILAGSLDEAKGTGHRTRLLRLLPGSFTKKPFVHDYWEEVWLVSGDLTVGNDEQGNGGTPYEQAAYACRPPGAWHGPFKSVHGCTLLEMHYYDNDTTSQADTGTA